MAKVVGLDHPSVFRTPAACHWLTLSSRLGCDRVRERLPRDGWSDPIPSTLFGCVGYQVHETGAKLYQDERGELTVVDCPGEVCESWAAEWLEHATRIRGRVTRIDVNVEVGPDDQARRRMLDLRRAWFADRVQTRVRTFQENRSYGPGEGFTWYFGGRTSPIRLRCYDRRGPLRLEFQWRPADQEALLAEVVAKDLDAVWRMLASRISFELKWYRELLVGPQICHVPGKRETDWERAADQLRSQWGKTLWALELLGVDVRQLAVEPDGGSDRHALAKFRKWSFQAGERGTALLAQVTARSRERGRPSA